MLKTMSWLTVAVIMVGSMSTVSFGQYDDNFNSPTKKPQWDTDFDGMSLSQSGGVVNAVVPASPPAESEGVFVSSNNTHGFYMSTWSDFEVQIEYSFTAYSATNLGEFDDDLSVFFGVAADPNGNNFAGIGRTKAYVPTPPFGHMVVAQPSVAWRLDNVTSQHLFPVGSGSDTGTFTVSYDEATDRFSFSDGTNNYTITTFGPSGNTGDDWDTDGVYVMFGIRSQFGGVQSATAFFDNFNIVSGSAGANPIPEPASALLLLTGSVLLLRRRR